MPDIGLTLIENIPDYNKLDIDYHCTLEKKFRPIAEKLKSKGKNMGMDKEI